MKLTNSYVGQPVERIEDLRFLRGRGEYIDDVHREGQWHAVILRSAVAHGRLISIDTSAALAMPGVHVVMTAADIGVVPKIPLRRPSPNQAPYLQPVIATDRVRFVGEPIAVVLADSVELAEDALQVIDVQIEPLPVIVDRAASARGDVLLFEGTSHNRICTFAADKGDTDAAFAAADYVRRASFAVQRLIALPMETRGLLAEWDAASERMRVSGAAKAPFTVRQILARMMDLPTAQVDLIENDVGGGFGARGEFYPEDFLIPFAARKYGHPVKWTEDRREHFLAMNHSREMDCDIEIACRQDGTILGIRGDLFVNMGAYSRPSGNNAARISALFMSGPYRIPNIRLRSVGLCTNKTPAGVYRGPGRFEACYFMERLIDLASSEMGIDPLEMRRRNLLTADEMPYGLATMDPDDGFGQTACDSGHYLSTFERCLEEVKWAQRIETSGRLIDGRYFGLGIACFIEGGAAGPRENAKLVLEADGTVSIYVGSSAIGQGVVTVLAQIAADALELPIERLRIYHGSTTYLAEGFGSFASRATVMGGSAILDGAAKLLDKVRAAAAARLGVDGSDLRIRDGMVATADGRSIGFGQLAADGLTADGTFANSKSTYAYGTAAAYVAVDPKTGQVEVLDYVVVDDVGRAINPLTLHGQVIGATVQGLGGVFSEHLPYDDNGQLLVGSLADYLAPLATDYPVVRAVTTELYPSPNNPLGAKGAGEGGIIPPGGVIANAVAAALRELKVEPNVLPLTPEAVWTMIQDALERKAATARISQPMAAS